MVMYSASTAFRLVALYAITRGTGVPITVRICAMLKEFVRKA